MSFLLLPSFLYLLTFAICNALKQAKPQSNGNTIIFCDNLLQNIVPDCLSLVSNLNLQIQNIVLRNA